jgi:transglutaminase-like putative cysteine protease
MMKANLLWSGLLLLLVAPVHAKDAGPGKLIKETWDAAYLEGARTGYYHTTIREVERNGETIYVATLEMSLTIKRFNDIVKMRMQTGAEETADGKVVGLFLTHFLDRDKRFVMTGRVKDGKLLRRANNDPKEQAVPWNDKVIGLYKQDRLFKENKVKPGDVLEYLNYELVLPAPVAAVRIKALVKEPQEVDVLEVKTEGGKEVVQRVKQKLLRVEAVPDKVEIGGNAIPLPRFVSWLDSDYQPVRSQMDMPGLGQVTMYRTTETVARQEGVAPALLPDLGLGNLIALNRKVDRMHQLKEVVYRVMVKDDDDPTTVFFRDDRQAVRNRVGQTFELVVKALKPEPAEKPGTVRPEYLKSSFFLNSDDPRIKELAARIVKDETNPWQKALRIERWVFDHMKGNNGIGFITASQIARDLEGDCRQHAMLSAALCRAVGVPSRTAIGLVYGEEPKHGPVLAFHMWTEVWVKGQWLPLDATLGMAGVGPGHLKIAEHSWTDTQTLAPLLPVIRALGKIKVEVLSAE